MHIINIKSISWVLNEQNPFRHKSSYLINKNNYLSSIVKVINLGYFIMKVLSFFFIS
jgi:hypothetical protein